MLERSIPVDHIKKVIARPDKKEDTFERRVKVTKKIEERKLVVIYYKEDSRVLILSATHEISNQCNVP